MTTKPMLAKPVPGAGTISRDTLLRPDAEPDALLEEIRSLVADQYRSARRLAIEAATRFPEHAGLQNAKRILDEGKASVSQDGPSPNRSEEFEWLRHPPESVRGKWVALVGSRLVGAAESLAELAESLKSQSFARTPLVHRID